MSLTPRETSSGLRRPRLAAAPKGTSSAIASALEPLVAELPSISNKDMELAEMNVASFLRPPPTQEALRSSLRSLKERRVQRVSKVDPTPDRRAKDATASALSAVIRSRTAMTMRQAHLQPGGADVDATREIELYRQRTRLEDLRRTFDLLHAELITKEEV